MQKSEELRRDTSSTEISTNGQHSSGSREVSKEVGNEVVQEQEKNERIRKVLMEASEKKTGEEREERVGRRIAYEELKNLLNRIKEKEEVYFYELKELVERAKRFLDPEIFGEEVFKAFLEKLDATLEDKDIIYSLQELNKLINSSSELKRVRIDLGFYENLLSHPLFVLYHNKREWTSKEIHKVYESIRKITMSKEDVEEVVREVLHEKGFSLQERKAELGEEDIERLVEKVKKSIQEELERLLEEKFKQFDQPFNREELVDDLKRELMSWFEEKLEQAKEELGRGFGNQVETFEVEEWSREDLKESIKEEILRELRGEEEFSYTGRLETDEERLKDMVKEEVSYFFEQELKETLKEEIKNEILSWIEEQGGVGGVGYSEPLRVDIEGLLERVQRLEERFSEWKEQSPSKSDAEEKESTEKDLFGSKEGIKKDLFGSSEEGDKEEEIFASTVHQESPAEQTTAKGKKGKKKDNFMLYVVVGGLILVLLILLLF